MSLQGAMILATRHAKLDPFQGGNRRVRRYDYTRWIARCSLAVDKLWRQTEHMQVFPVADK